MQIPVGDTFWADESDRLWASVIVTLSSMLMEGARGGADLIPEGLSQFVNWDLFDQRAISALQNLKTNWWDGIAETTRKNAFAEIEDWIKSGGTMQDLEDRFISKHIFSPERAGLIATTETTRIFQTGNNEIWGSTGFIDSEVYHTAEDEHVCELCDELDGTHVGIDDTDAQPPIHSACRCYCTPEVNEDKVQAMIDEALA